MNLRVLKLFCWINWPINSFCTMSFCLIFRLPSQILAFIRGLPDFFVFCFNRLPSVSINFYLSFCEKNLVLPCPSLSSSSCLATWYKAKDQCLTCLIRLTLAENIKQSAIQLVCAVLDTKKTDVWRGSFRKSGWYNLN